MCPYVHRLRGPIECAMYFRIHGRDEHFCWLLSRFRVIAAADIRPHLLFGAIATWIQRHEPYRAPAHLWPGRAASNSASCGSNSVRGCPGRQRQEEEACEHPFRHLLYCRHVFGAPDGRANCSHRPRRVLKNWRQRESRRRMAQRRRSSCTTATFLMSLHL
jgi:hypothetical protein